MRTERQLAILRAGPPTKRVAPAISMTGVTQVSVAAAIGVTQAYVSDVARQRHRTITVANATGATPAMGVIREHPSRRKTAGLGGSLPALRAP